MLRRSIHQNRGQWPDLPTPHLFSRSKLDGPHNYLLLRTIVNHVRSDNAHEISHTPEGLSPAGHVPILRRFHSRFITVGDSIHACNSARSLRITAANMLPCRGTATFRIL